MNEEQLRTWLAGRLKLPFVPDHLWNRLDASTRELARDDEAEREPLYEAANEFVEYKDEEDRFIEQGGYEGHIQATEDVEPRNVEVHRIGTIIGRDEPITKLDEGQTLAFSSVIADEAARHPDVVEARERILGSRVLSADQFLSFVMSPANRYLLFSDLESRGICPVEHDAKVIESSITDGITDVGAYPSHQEYTIEHHQRDHTGLQWMTVEMRTQNQRVRVERSTSNHADVILYLAPDPKQPEKVGFGQITAWRGSSIGELWSVAETLSSVYPWRVPEAFTFMVAGMFPILRGVSSTVRYHPSTNNTYRYARINISAVPWASTEAVVAQFRAEQEFLLMSKKRSFFAKKLTLTTFVTTQLMLARLRQHAAPGWSVIRDEWNKNHSEWEYANANYLRNDYYRARRRIQNYPTAFPCSIEEEIDRYKQLQRQDEFEPMLINPQKVSSDSPKRNE